MDGLVKEWTAFSRRFPFPCTLDALDYIEGKDYWTEQAFASCGFAFIFKGSGEFRRAGEVHQVTAPCVITLWPGDAIAYGPSQTTVGWDELYLAYGESCQSYLRARGFFKEDRVTWPIHNMKPVWSMAEELTTLARGANPADVVDRIDSICDRMILESLSPAEEEVPLPKDLLMEQIALYVKDKLANRHDFDRLAEAHGLSVSTFRRRWLQAFEMPPWRYVLNLRIQQARRLLSDSNLSVNKIAEQCGFDDALYFSRRFRIETRVSPSEYRQQFSRY